MDELFGLSMNTIMYVLLVMLALCLSISLLIFLFDRVIFLIGLRNISRRVAQTVLIIVGLMLSTIIITAAFTTGDTVDYSITKEAYTLLGHSDVVLDGQTGGIVEQAPGQTADAAPSDDEGGHSVSSEQYQAFLDAADNAKLPDVDGYTGIIFAPVPVVNTTTNLSEPDVIFTGIDETRMEAFPDIVDDNTGDVLNVADLGPDEVYMNRAAADELDATPGQKIDTYFDGVQHTLTIKAIVKTNALSGAHSFGNRKGMVASLTTVQGLLGIERLDNVLVSVTGGVRPDLDTVDKVEGEVQQLMIQNNIQLEVSDTKATAVHDAEEAGNVFTTFFLALGLFSIGSGMLLIVMTFVMLAAERKTEMGMARAIGAKRRHLIEMFIAEGTGYDLVSALVGVTLGVAVAFALALAASALFSAFGLTFTPHATLRTLVISYSLGVVLTFITVLFSSWRISNLNIVAAIRDTAENKPLNPEAGTFRGYLRSLLNSTISLLFPIGTFMYVLRGSEFAGSRDERPQGLPAPWFPLPAGFLGFPFYQIAMLITGRERIPTWPFYFSVLLAPFYIVSIGVYRLFRDHRPSKMPVLALIGGIVVPPLGLVLVAMQEPRRPIIWGPGLWTQAVLFGLYMFMIGLSSNAAFPFALGVSLILGGTTVVLTYFGAPARLSYTSMGVLLLVFWGLTAGNRLESIFGVLEGDIEMFFLSGVAMVTASTFVVIYNADLFLGVVERVGGAFGSILPALRTAIAYPMANRFRTGMTLAMISLVVFALTMMSAMNLNYDKLFSADESRGGWDVQVVENPNNPIPSIQEALQEKGSAVADNIAREGTVEIAGDSSATEVSQDGLGWTDYPVHGFSDGFLEAGSVPLDKIANGYETQQDVWLALRDEPDAAVTDGFTVVGGGFDDTVTIEGIPTDVTVKKYDAPTAIVRDAVSGNTRVMRIIGVISFGASQNFQGVGMGAQSFEETFGPPVMSIHFLTLKDPGNSEDVAKEIESTLVVTGVQADSLKQIAERSNALSRNFLYLMQAFMSLGLVVGIAAIGVIAFRTVVERRQQIGMLRAIGYKRSTVALSFLLESSFVTVLGLLSGMGLGLWLAYFLVTSSDFPAENAKFYIPWLQLAFFAVLTIAASLAMTWIPARQAASVPTAEALRYE